MSQPSNYCVESPPKVVVVMVPLPAQGHLNQLLHLSRIISTRGIPVHFIGSTTHNRQAKDRVHGWNPYTTPNLHFHDFQLPQIVTPPPVSTKFLDHLVPTFEAGVHLREPLAKLLRDFSTTDRRVVVVYDSLMGFAAQEASFISNTEAYSFIACSAFSVLHFIWEMMGKPAYEEGGLFPEELPRVSFDDCFSDEITKIITKNSQWSSLGCAGHIYDTCNAIEGKFVNLMAQTQLDKKLWAIGPFNPVTFDSTGSSRHWSLEWLDKQPPNSVLYVSFGTTTSLSDDQIAELAIGLERSEQRFIWVLRDADRGDIYTEEGRKPQLPDGFEERIKGIGVVVRDWAPQAQILGHPSTGGFMSHCGWNSTMESLSMGVPIAAWPMHSDQPKNAVLITDVLKAGLMVRDWACRNDLISSDMIESSIKKLMVLDEGNMMRKNASELGTNIREALSEGGTSAIQLEAFLSHISR
ncbi:hypothetical protein AQUCO_00900322v1 [Aquilegia coerulea]|uniref:Glycosyltransferase n=1 Tax=Aquilegia coerulea TaxID=218851 RepID=A0A2G5ED23_AQUCA|nr:hypothetical protein AQUCO_00900322v1 [Aquilegia coerulea]